MGLVDLFKEIAVNSGNELVGFTEITNYLCEVISSLNLENFRTQTVEKSDRS